jgi:hypothetical protein
MVTPPPVPPSSAEEIFLSELWDRLERALELSISDQVFARLEEVRGECEAAASLIRQSEERRPAD